MLDRPQLDSANRPTPKCGKFRADDVNLEISVGSDENSTDNDNHTSGVAHPNKYDPYLQH